MASGTTIQPTAAVKQAANSRFNCAIEIGNPLRKYVGSSHGLAGTAGIWASRSAIEPPPKAGAAHSGSGLGHQ